MRAQYARKSDFQLASQVGLQGGCWKEEHLTHEIETVYLKRFPNKNISWKEEHLTHEIET